MVIRLYLKALGFSRTCVVMKLSVLMQSPFKDLFPIDNNVLCAVKESMETVGYDYSKPLDIWNNIVVDGHTRIAAAKQAGIVQIPVYEHKFPDEQQALEYAIHNQRDRRNMTDADILRCVEVLDKKKAEGRPKKTTSNDVVSGRTSSTTASIIGTSSSKVERARTVLNHANEETKKQVQSGKKTINRAYNETQDQRKHLRSHYRFGSTYVDGKPYRKI